MVSMMGNTQIDSRIDVPMVGVLQPLAHAQNRHREINASLADLSQVRNVKAVSGGETRVTERSAKTT